MPWRFLLPLLFAPWLLAHADCVDEAQNTFYSCRRDCVRRGTETERNSCRSQCNLDYSTHRKECSAQENRAADGGCVETRDSDDGRIRFRCDPDDHIYETYGECRTYCR